MDQFSNHPLCRRHNIDSAISSLWEFYKKYFLTLFIISLIMSLVMQYASTFVDIKDLKTITDPMILLEKFSGYLVPFLIISLVNLLFTTILQYYIIYSPLDKEYNIFVSILRSFKYYIPYLICRLNSYCTRGFRSHSRDVFCHALCTDTLSFHFTGNDDRRGKYWQYYKPYFYPGTQEFLVEYWLGCSIYYNIDCYFPGFFRDHTYSLYRKFF
jgi:hypothetical protein